MKLICKFFLMLVICCFVSAVLGQPKAMVQNNTDKVENNNHQTQQTLPRGKWSISAVPFTGQGYNSVPVMVSAVFSTYGNGIGPSVEDVRMLNLSNKTVNTVTVAWTLKNEKDQSSVVLQQGHTPVIKISDKQRQSGGYTSIHFPVVSFDEICKPLLVNGELNGVFRIEIYISAVEFMDGSVWSNETKESAKGNVERVSYKAPIAPLVITPFVAPTCTSYICGEGPLGRGCYEDEHQTNLSCRSCTSGSTFKCCTYVCNTLPCDLGNCS
jgi:hypothetical protein